MATLSRITVDGTTHLIASSAYGYCTNNADTVAKTVTIQGSQDFYRTNGATVHVYFLNQNTADSPTLNVGGTGAKPIYAYSVDGTTTVKPLWPARSMISFTYNGSADSNGCWSMNDVANGRVGAYELAYNTTVNASEVLEAINSKKQIIVAKTVTGDFTTGMQYGYLSSYEFNPDLQELVGLYFDVPGGSTINTEYGWSKSNGWSTSTTRLASESHASTASTYGLGNASNYGHVKLSNSISSTSSAADGIAATPSAIKAVNDAIPTSTDYYILPKVFKAIAASGTSTITFTSGTYTRGVVLCSGYGNAVKGMYIVTCTKGGVVGYVSVYSATGAALTTASYKLTVKNNNSSNGINCDFIPFAGGGTIA